ncbi:alpha/beta hydrolase fold domain-containing protein [Streptomyces anandii]|uniref:Alpha/beta hydrolase fold domain-containing protein n=1 Tax=Streptomyces anandii TaxID=285454 RepID=A0ABW6H3I9_9ACTN
MTPVPPPPPFDPELAAALEEVAGTLGPGLTPQDIETARRSPAVELSAALDLTMDGAFEAEDREVPGPPGAPRVSLLICRPTAPPAGGPRPVIYHVHGGGMVLGNSRLGVEAALNWAKELDGIVVSVEYRLAPARAEDLSGLPPAFLDVGSAETFRDEVVAYASRIWQAGGAAELHVWPGGFHGFDGFVPQAALSRAARAAQLDWLRRLLAR